MKRNTFSFLGFAFSAAVLFSGDPAVSATLGLGTRDGGGGVGVACPGKPLELLDLYEARRRGFVLEESEPNQKKAIKLAAKKIADHFWYPGLFTPEILSKAIAEVLTSIFAGQDFDDLSTTKKNHVVFVESLPLSNDLGQYEIPSDCALKQIAYFSDTTSTLSIALPAWEALDWQNRSALVAHELSYRFTRQEALENINQSGKASTSEIARDLVGRLFTLNRLHTRYEAFGDEGVDYVQCSDQEGQTNVLGFDADDGSVTILFENIYGRESLFEVTADLPHAAVKGLWRYDGDLQFDTVSELKIWDEQKAPKFQVHFVKEAGSAFRLQLLQDSSAGSHPLGPMSEMRCTLKTVPSTAM